jgi:hypothetical protein
LGLDIFVDDCPKDFQAAISGHSLAILSREC